MTNDEFQLKVKFLKHLGLVAAVGFLIMIIALVKQLASTRPPVLLIFCAFILVMPAIVYLVLLTLWHWKSRYRGEHSNLWGGLLVLETSGWCKLIYLFRHIIPDARGRGRYAANTNHIET